MSHRRSVPSQLIKTTLSRRPKDLLLHGYGSLDRLDSGLFGLRYSLDLGLFGLRVGFPFIRGEYSLAARFDSCSDFRQLTQKPTVLAGTARRGVVMALE